MINYPLLIFYSSILESGPISTNSPQIQGCEEVHGIILNSPHVHYLEYDMYYIWNMFL